MRTIPSLTVAAAVFAAVLLAPAIVPADEDLGVSAGKIKTITLPMAGATAGKVYFEIEPTESGAPSAFKVDATNLAAVQILVTARSAGLPIKVSYKSDFTVTELDF